MDDVGPHAVSRTDGVHERVEWVVLYAGLAGIFQAGLDLVFFDELMRTVPAEVQRHVRLAGAELAVSFDGGFDRWWALSWPITLASAAGCW